MAAMEDSYVDGLGNEVKLEKKKKKASKAELKKIKKAIAEKRKYQEVTDPEEMDFAMNFFLGEYNEMTSKPMSLVLFQNAIEHVSRISRVMQAMELSPWPMVSHHQSYMAASSLSCSSRDVSAVSRVPRTFLALAATASRPRRRVRILMVLEWSAQGFVVGFALAETPQQPPSRSEHLSPPLIAHERIRSVFT